MTWAERVRKLREFLGLSQKELAALLNTQQRAIHDWESGSHDPTSCHQRLLKALEADPPMLFEMLSVIVMKQPRSWAGRIRRLRDRLDLSAEDFARLVGVSRLTILNWEDGAEPRGCSQMMVELAESRFEDAGRFLWPKLMTPPEGWSSERIQILLDNLGLDEAGLATLLRMAQATVTSWKREMHHPDYCAHALLWLLEVHGPDMAEALSAIPIGQEWNADRVSRVREQTGLTAEEFSELLEVSIGRVFEKERQGLSPTRGCDQLLYQLLESNPERMVQALRELPRRIQTRWEERE